MTSRPVALLFSALLALAGPSHGTASIHRVATLQEFEAAVPALQAGDELVMANGVWTDVELRLKAEGSADQPIALRAEEPGKVIISGHSNLGLSGSHLVVSGLVFKDGYTPTSEVISFRTSKTDLAHDSRVTNTVIDDFSNPERFSSDTWVAMYGKRNRFDHNSLIGKGNRGVTLAIRMNSEGSQENGHIVESNYFGPRQTLGSNGGETLRVGTSHFSRKYANAVVRNNFFDRTSGELEIISSKSCGNTFDGNVFFESQGTLTMRHGHYTLVENNYFIGNRVPNTGGIRIINENQTVRKNYLYGLTGHRFRGALVIMNGVPNGPINRYDPVINSTMSNNIVVDSDHIQLCAGSDEERSAPPTGSAMHNNIFMSQTNPSPFTVYDDISGISFEGNVINKGAEPPVKQGFKHQRYRVKNNPHGLAVPRPALTKAIGFKEVRLPITKAQAGALFYAKREPAVAFLSGAEIAVPPGTNTILAALGNSSPGDTLVLTNGGEYSLTKLARIRHPITIMSRGGDKPLVRSEKLSFFVIENGGALELDNVWMDGADSPDIAGNAVVSTSRYSMNRNYSLAVRNSKVTNLDVNHSFHFLKVYMSTFADRIEISNTEMSNVTGSILSLNKETEDLGIYNAENIILTGNTFTDIQGAVADIYRGGTDESTFGPIVSVASNRFIRTGQGRRNRSGASLKFHGVQRLNIKDSYWESSAPLTLYLTNGEPITEIDRLVMKETGRIVSNSDQYQATDVSYQ